MIPTTGGRTKKWVIGATLTGLISLICGAANTLLSLTHNPWLRGLLVASLTTILLFLVGWTLGIIAEKAVKAWKRVFKALRTN